MDQDTKRIKITKKGGLNKPQILESPLSQNIFLNNPSSQEFVANQPLYEGFSITQIAAFGEYLEEKEFEAKEYIFKENQTGQDIFFILNGEVDILKRVDATNEEIVLKTFKKGDYFGEMAVLNSEPRSASVFTKTKTHLLFLSQANLHRLKKEKLDLYTQFLENLAKKLGDNLKHISEHVVEDYKIKLDKEKLRSFMGKFFCYSITTLGFWTILLKYVTENPNANTDVITPVICLVFGVLYTLMIKYSGYPLSTFGFSFKNWKKYSVQATLWTIPFLLLMLIAKYFWMKVSTEEMTLFSFAVFERYQFKEALIFSILYSIFIPVQEIIFRGVFQSSLHQVLSGTGSNFLAALMATIIFVSSHLHLDIAFALIVFIPGLFWGIIYSKQRTLVGVSVSHMLIGWWAIFLIPGF